MNKIKEMIKNILSNMLKGNKVASSLMMKIYWLFTLIFVSMTIFYECNNGSDFELDMEYIILYSCYFLPLIIIYLIDYLIKIFKIENKIFIKAVSWSVNIVCIIWVGLLFFAHIVSFLIYLDDSPWQN